MWIWTGEKVPKRNAFVEFRKEFSGKKTLKLQISADSRYWLYVNGELIGHGPARGWPKHWSYDEYEVSGRAGRNVVAVLVNHLGEGTFQYIPAPAGLWVRGLEGRRVAWETDATWRCRIAKGPIAATVRIGVQEGFEEQYDGRRDDGWRESGYNDRGWKRAMAAPRRKLEPRDIPYLTRKPVFPQRVLRSERLKPADHVWTLNPRPYYAPGETASNLSILKAFLFTQVWSERAQEIGLLRPHGSNGAFRVNAATVPEIAPGDELIWQKARLKKGWNFLLVPFPRADKSAEGVNPPGCIHLPQFTLAVRAKGKLRWSADRSADRSADGSPWAFVGPFAFSKEEEAERTRHMDYPGQILPKAIHPDATDERWREITEGGGARMDFASAPYFRMFRAEDIYRNDAAAASFADKAVGGHAVENAPALLCDNAEWAAIPPGGPGEDVRVLLDFGREVVGGHVMEIEAAAGTVIDFHNFEFIQANGRENHSNMMNNSCRYVCRQGRQAYRTLQRRGFRYSWLIVRQQTGPVRVRKVAVEMSTYPQERRGSFACSDFLLSKIWEVGAYTLACCAEDTYTDCPTYEQVHWIGDAYNEALIDWMANGDGRLWRHCLLQAGQSLETAPLVQSHVPSAWNNIIPLFSFLWMRSCWNYLLWTGDYAGARKLLPWVRRQVDGIERHLTAEGLLKIQAWNFFDWAPMDIPADGVVTHNNCFAALALEESAKLAHWLKDRRAEHRFRKLAEKIRAAVNRRLWSRTKRAYVDCIHADGRMSPVFSQQTQTAALVSGVARGGRARRCREMAHCPPEDFVKAGSPFFEFFLLEVLAQEGRTKEFLDLIRKDWGFMIREGATTFWESWTYQGEGRLTRSHCHGWAGAPTYFLSRIVLGIEPLEPGCARVRWRPRLGDLAYARGAVPTPHGVIEVASRRRAGRVEHTMKAPRGVKVVRG